MPKRVGGNGDLTLADLSPAPYNPRKISDEAMAGLGVSLREFGDISGLVWNRRTRHLVAGHQRLASLQKEHGDALALVDGAVVTPAGERFPMRVVDWPAAKEKAANLVANNPHIAGQFTEGLSTILAELDTELPDLVKGLRLDALKLDLPMIPADNQQIDEQKLAETQHECPKCGFKW